MTVRSFARAGTAVLLLAFLLGACGARDEDSNAIRIGINAWPGYEFLYLAQEQGFFRDAGVNVKLIEFSSLGDARRSYERGQIDGLACTLVEVIQSTQTSGRHPEVFHVIDNSSGADVILARGDAVDGSLRGRRIGVEINSLGMYMLARALEAQQLSLQDVQVTASDQLSMEAAFSRGELDAIVTYPPTSIRLRRDTGATPIYSTQQIPKEVIDVIALDRSVRLADPDAASRISAAYYRAVEFHRRSPQVANAIMARREGVSPDEFAQALQQGIELVPQAAQREFFGADGRLRELLPRVAGILHASGQVTGPMSTDGLVNDRVWIRP